MLDGGLFGKDPVYQGGRIYYIMADENKRVVIYTRVSTQEQSADGYSLGEQSDRLQMYAKAHSWTVVRTYTDPGYSGAKLERPAIQQLIRDCRSRSFDAVLIYKLDRLSRSQKDTLHLIEDIFNPAGIGLISMIWSCLVVASNADDRSEEYWRNKGIEKER